jgi:hypothetical protein
MRYFFWGDETVVALVGWHIAVFTAFIAGYSLAYFLGHHKRVP